ncbi:hypothetical protein ACH0B5_14285 [Ureibacillus sp. 179-F W5.1 NHS]|uniref:Uncharacterized protein n=1 Tax=Lysinibacillus halotolerans TaxID=1368476 RepID=A0A3M8HA84_9BACI|nr:hypothetical protein [Lysinibacillus halotolerans]RNC99343.1 hypothetical protein EC501_08360 [Lysinibacillus halotolerans]
MLVNLLILSITLLTLSLVLYIVGKLAEREWLKYFSIVPAIAGVIILIVVAVKYFFPGII